MTGGRGRSPGDFQQRWGAAQIVAPIRQVFGKAVLGSLLVLPRCDIAVLDRQSPQDGLVSFLKCRVKRRQFAPKHPFGRPIRDDMVHHQQEHMVLLVEPEQGRSDSRLLLERVRDPRLLRQ